MMRNRVKLTEDERRKFDDIGLDEINQLTDMPSLQKLMQYMEYVPDSLHHCYFFLSCLFFLCSLVTCCTDDDGSPTIIFSIQDMCHSSSPYGYVYYLLSGSRDDHRSAGHVPTAREAPWGVSRDVALLKGSRSSETSDATVCFCNAVVPNSALIFPHPSLPLKRPKIHASFASQG